MKDRLDESLSSILILNTFAHTMGARKSAPRRCVCLALKQRP